MSSEMLTNRVVRLVSSLAESKGRRKEGLFVAEGAKCVRDTAAAFRARYLFILRDHCEEFADMAEKFRASGAEVMDDLSRGDMQRLSSLSTVSPVLAVYEIPEVQAPSPEVLMGQLVVALDRIQDPGNLGTIIRTADWMGVTTILASRDTVDVFSPKVVQATMGAISRVRVCYTDLVATLGELRDRGAEIFGTYLGGENIYTATLPANAVVVMGNEGSGISVEVGTTVTRRLLIPSYPVGAETSESLNVATATAITLSTFRSRLFS